MNYKKIFGLVGVLVIGAVITINAGLFSARTIEFPGNFQVGYTTNGTGFKGSNFNGNIKNVTHVELKRGIIYGAVKWNGKWKAARIGINN
jgi:hypothetical protein